MSLEKTPFGKPMRKHFHFNPFHTPINHGSFGAFPHYVQKAQHRFQAQLEQRPDSYLRYGYPWELFKSRRAVAELMNADLDELVFVPNATTGYNTVLRSIVWEEGDHILYLDIAYGSLVKTIKYLEETTKVKAKRLDDVRFPLSDDALVAAFERAITAVNSQPGKRVRLAVFDTVASLPGIRLPYERLVRKCRELDVLSLVDGAHGVGQIALDLKGLDADFFVTNLHKWLHMPRAAAALQVAGRHQGLIRTTVPTSHAFRPLDTPPDAPPFWPSVPQPRFVELFEFVGTLDSQHYLTAPAALEWRRKVCGGEDAVRAYVDGLARAGGDAVAAMLGTEVMDCEGSRARDCAFANVRLPLEMGDGPGQVRSEDIPALHEWIVHYSVVAFDSYFLVIPYHGNWWVRLSAQVYLDMDDYVWTGQRLKEMCDKIRLGREEYTKNGKCRLCVESNEKSKL